MLKERIDEVGKIHDFAINLNKKFKEYCEIFTRTIVNTIPIFTPISNVIGGTYTNAKFNVGSYKIKIHVDRSYYTGHINYFLVKVKHNKKVIFSSKLKGDGNGGVVVSEIASSPTHIVDMDYMIDFIEAKVKEYDIQMGDF